MEAKKEIIIRIVIQLFNMVVFIHLFILAEITL